MDIIVVCNGCGAEFSDTQWFGSTAPGCPQCDSNDIYVIAGTRLIEGTPCYFDGRIAEGQNLPVRRELPGGFRA